MVRHSRALAPGPNGPKKERAAASRTAPTQTILVVDHRAVVRHGWVGLVAKMSKGARIIEVGDVTDVAVALVEAGSVDLVVLKLEIPGVEHFSHLRDLRRALPKAPIAAILTSTDRASRVIALLAGADSLIPEDVSEAEMAAALSQTVAGEIYLPTEDREALWGYRPLTRMSAQDRWNTYWGAFRDGVIVTCRVGYVVDCNPALEETYGFAKEELLGYVPGFLVAGEGAGDLGPAIRTALAAGRWEGDHEFRRKDGTTGFVNVIITLMHDDDGGALGLLWVCRDVSERRAKEGVHAQACSILETLGAQTGVGVCLMDAEFRVVWMDSGMTTYLDGPVEPVLGEDMRVLLEKQITPNFEDGDDFSQMVFAAYGSRSDVTGFEVHVGSKSDGGKRWVSYTSTLITCGPFKGGRLDTYLDASARKQREAEAHESAAWFKNLIESMNAGFVVTDDHDQISYVNTAMANMLLRNRQDLIGRGSLEYLADEPGPFEEQLARRRRGERSSYELALSREDDTRLTALVSGAPIFDEDGKVSGSVAVALDVSLRKKREIEDHLRASILEDLGSPVVATDTEGLVTYANRYARRRYHLVAGGSNLWGLLHPGKTAEEIEAFANNLRASGSWSGECRLRIGLGGEVDTHQNITANYDDDGNLTGFACIESLAGIPQEGERITLTPRQSQVLSHLAEGDSNKQIARSLGVEEATVKLHVHKILVALGVRNRTQAVLLAKREGLVTPSETVAIA